MLQAFAFAFTVLLIAALAIALDRALSQVDELKDRNRSLSWDVLAAQAGLNEARQFVAELAHRQPVSDGPVVVLNGETLLGYREIVNPTNPTFTFYEWTN
jgi:hypothetical protein